MLQDRATLAGSTNRNSYRV